jgi:hypothetical protein
MVTSNKHYEEFNNYEKYRAAKFRELVDYNETYKCPKTLCSLKYAKFNLKPLQSLLRYRQIGLSASTNDDAYKPLEFPSVWSLTGLIRACFKPFEKQLTENDVQDMGIQVSCSHARVEEVLS